MATGVWLRLSEHHEHEHVHPAPTPGNQSYGTLTRTIRMWSIATHD